MKKIMCLVFFVMAAAIIAACGESKTENEDLTGTTPNAFVFKNATSVALSTDVISNSITVTGITNSSTKISVDSGYYEIDDNGWTSYAGTIANGQTVRLRHTSSSANSTTITQTLTIGTVSGTFSSKTVAASGGGTTTEETGKSLWNSNCSGCHNVASAMAGITVSDIKSNSMTYGLTDAQLQKIVDYLNTLK